MSRQIDINRTCSRWLAARVAAAALLIAAAPGIGPVAAGGSGAKPGSDAVSIWASAPAPGHPFGIAVDDDRVYVSTSAGDFFAGHQNSDDERYAREWLEQQAATGLVDVDDTAAPAARRCYTLPDGYAEALLNLDSPLSMAPFGRSIVGVAKVLPQLLDAYRTGGGVDWADYGPDMVEAQGDSNRPWLRGSFGSEILPAIPAIHDRLIADPPARVADVACGVGWAGIAIATAYPNVRVDGFDLDPSSIDLARANAKANGVGDRVTHAVRNAADPAAVGEYDLVVVVEAIHDLNRPVEVLAAMRKMLRPGGSVLIADEKTEDVFTAPASEMERLYYGYSLFTCLPAAMTERPTAATGTVMRADTLRRYVEEAGFTGFERLDESMLDMLRFYRLTP
jgi:2-polyprenyl-3-methyl-5-hydroxy-6-metoxy-1,4-benzoquinol methylase